VSSRLILRGSEQVPGPGPESLHPLLSIAIHASYFCNLHQLLQLWALHVTVHSCTRNTKIVHRGRALDGAVPRPLRIPSRRLPPPTTTRQTRTRKRSRPQKCSNTSVGYRSRCPRRRAARRSGAPSPLRSRLSRWPSPLAQQAYGQGRPGSSMVSYFLQSVAFNSRSGDLVSDAYIQAKTRHFPCSLTRT
jgi:hypothetical protein